jgi:hypothetical protein
MPSLASMLMVRFIVLQYSHFFIELVSNKSLYLMHLHTNPKSSTSIRSRDVLHLL